MPPSHWFLLHQPLSASHAPNSQHHSGFHHMPIRAPRNATVARLDIFRLFRLSHEQQPQTIHYISRVSSSLLRHVVPLVSFSSFFSLPCLPSSSHISPLSCILFFRQISVIFAFGRHTPDRHHFLSAVGPQPASACVYLSLHSDASKNTQHCRIPS